ncbi:MAG: 1,4-dihydroxy-6-naphthoate synthase [Leptospiraceae bacterium]|nr:1,4-dihydroxy-6-naphthoate synthase [Leptospiraceae bacterium]
MHSISLAYSPCPNDTFLFYHLIHEPPSKDFSIKEELHDVEELNLSSKKGKYEFTKLSFHAYFHVADQYQILDVGSALGRGCGPIWITLDSTNIPVKQKEILVPGIFTTANLLLQIYLSNQYTPIAIRYDKVIPELLVNRYESGVIIHEERFTYVKKGLKKIQDLGEFWENLTGLPIPLGCIVARRDLPPKLKDEFVKSLSQSLKLAYSFPEKTKEYILQNSQEKDLGVVESHIQLYVNEYTQSLGEEGKKAIERLYLEWLKNNPSQKRVDDIFY